MKRSLLIAAAAATAVALLTGCSASTEEAATPKPTATSEASPSTQPEGQPPKGADAKLVSFVDIAVASCDKILAEGGVAKAKGIAMITVPAAKAINKVADVAVVTSPDGKTANYILGPTPSTGQPMPFICSISGSANSDLMRDGKSSRFTESGGVWTWEEEQIKVVLTIKGDMITAFSQTSKQQTEQITVDYTMVYGLTDADNKAFAEAVKNPTKPAVAK